MTEPRPKPARAKPKPRPKPKPEPMWNLQGGTWTQSDPEAERSAIRMLADTLGVVGVWDDDHEGWSWVTRGETGDPKNQRINELFAVQVTYQGKSWIWAHRTQKAAEKMAATMKELDVKNVRTWHGRIEWEAL